MGSVQVVLGATLNVYGSGLTLNNGRLSGTLADGTVLDGVGISTSLAVGSPGTVNLIETPEPSPLVLMATAALLLAGSSWRRHRRAASSA